MTALGDKIAKHRKRLGLSIDDLADRSGVMNVLLRLLEDGPCRPDLKVATLLDLARALGVSPLLLAAAAFEDLSGDSS